MLRAACAAPEDGALATAQLHQLDRTPTDGRKRSNYNKFCFLVQAVFVGSCLRVQVPRICEVALFPYWPREFALRTSKHGYRRQLTCV